VARGRFLSSAISTNARLARISADAERLFFRILARSDVAGCIPDDPAFLRNEVAPALLIEGGWTVDRITRALEELLGETLILRGEPIAAEADAGPFIAITKFYEHQVGLQPSREDTSRWVKSARAARAARGAEVAPIPAGKKGRNRSDVRTRTRVAVPTSERSHADVGTTLEQVVPQEEEEEEVEVEAEEEEEDEEDRSSSSSSRPSPKEDRRAPVPERPIDGRTGSDIDRVMRCWKGVYAQVNAERAELGMPPMIAPRSSFHEAGEACEASVYFKTEESLTRELRRVARIQDRRGIPVTFRGTCKLIGQVFEDMGDDAEPVIWEKRVADGPPSALAREIARALPEMPQ
jgi:hypothetical protein